MSVVAKISKNTIVKKEVVSRDVVEVVKDVAIELLKSWDPTSSDFIILRDFYSVSYPAPCRKTYMKNLRNTPLSVLKTA